MWEQWEVIQCTSKSDAKDIAKLQNILFKQPALHRHISQLKERNIFHHAVAYAKYKSSDQDKADVKALQVLIDHEASYCAQNQGKLKIYIGSPECLICKLTTYRMFPTLQRTIHGWQNATTGVHSGVPRGHGAISVSKAPRIGLVQVG